MRRAMAGKFICLLEGGILLNARLTCFTSYVAPTEVVAIGKKRAKTMIIDVTCPNEQCTLFGKLQARKMLLAMATMNELGILRSLNE
jgi:hypothetical protein